MLGYLKLETNEEELYESDYLKTLKEKQGIIYKVAYYICSFFYKIIAKIKYIFNIITVKEIYNAYLFIMPFRELEKTQKIKICLKKVKKLMQKYNIQTLVAEEKLQKYHMFNKIIEDEIKKIHILDGRGIMPYLIKEIIEFTLKKQNLKTETEDLYICAKEVNNICVENIYYLIHYFKTVNIITPNIRQFQNIADQVENQVSTVITVTNNKKKSLKKSKIIVNFDFSEQEIKKYTIYRDATIITINKNGFYESCTYSGIQIRKVGISTSEKVKDFFEEYNLTDDCSMATLYESLINKKQNLEYVKEKMKKDEVKIITLYGKNGVL